ncbi:ATP-dependent RNA helicase Prp11 [Schizosaccharomyces japonicus yFS275]|uniref:RNA helicase n=1 Tax=Schizosaccharomyces japonicus (strain yFS275 / FY16936) TaxID=402676 RepID=B6K0K2_SCHJY|nr:ATP-dependent RNA helicase Prp11 [Schizosaccharomyces japonicus yFS275]EEB07473.1 ATP-dependent RNA helicase Prp11 [Schizosaccharomyces japonicus yFS275]
MSKRSRSRSPDGRNSYYNNRKRNFSDQRGYNDREDSRRRYGSSDRRNRDSYRRDDYVSRDNRGDRNRQNDRDVWRHDRYSDSSSRSSQDRSRRGQDSSRFDRDYRSNYHASDRSSHGRYSSHEHRKETQHEQRSSPPREAIGRSARRSRFDQPSAAPAAASNVSSSSEAGLTVPTVSVQASSTVPAKSSVAKSSAPDNSSSAVDAESLANAVRVPKDLDSKKKARLERLNAWKKSKAEELAKAESNLQQMKEAQTAANSEISSVENTEKANKRVVPSLMPSSGISGFNIVKQNNAVRIGRIQMDDEVLTKRPGIAELMAEEDDDSAMDTDGAAVPGNSHDNEVDPLDAYMASLEGVTDVVRPGLLNAEVVDGTNDEDDLYEQSTTLAEEENILALAAKRMKKKDFITVDHSKINYEDFRKNFYVEPEELKKLSLEEVDELRLSLGGIKIRGIDCPKPVTSWSQCGLSVQTLSVIRSLGFEEPSAIQAQAIPAITAGRDVIGVAKTGSGKTIAFLLPMFRHIMDQRPLRNGEGPVAVIMTPTRELAVQIFRECKPFAKALDLRATCAYGGAPIKDQIAELKRGAEIVVCTPGRMIDVLNANSGRVTNLHRCTYVVLDEADRMFDLGFEPQVMRILNNIRPDRQVVLFSATFPRAMEALARKVLKKPIEITVGGRSVVAAEVEQLVEVRSEESKFPRLLELLGELYNTQPDVRTLVFVDRHESADALLSQLMKRGYSCNSIHGGKDQHDRDSTISDYKMGIFDVLIATSVAARGLDVKSLQLVVNYDCPNHMEDYVHRVGRTGRAGHTGVAVTFVTPDQSRYAVGIAKALKMSKQPVPLELQNLANEFLKNVKSGKEKAAGSGFGGKGLSRLDETRNAERKMQRRAFGEDVEEEEEENEEAVKPLEPLPEGQSTGDLTLDRVRAAVGGIAARALSASQLQKNKLAQPITVIKTDNDEFKAKMEINDYPQQARWAVTNSANIVHVTELTGTSITTKGNFYLPGKNPEAGEEKLYLLIEGHSELDVNRAVTELRRLLLEGIGHSLEDGNRSAPTGRYSVV